MLSSNSSPSDISLFMPMLASVDPWILSFSLVTVIVTIVMGFWSARKAKTASDFFVAGRSVSVGWNASAISGEYLSAASFMGIAGMVMSAGYDALWYPVCYACGYLFLLLFIAGPLRRFGAYTIPDFAEGRFDSPLFRKIAVIFVLFIGFFYTMPQMKGAGTTLAYIFPGLPYWVGVALVGAVITFNVALGGMKGITLVQAFQYWIKVFAISVPVFVLMAVYGHYGTQLSLNGKKSDPSTTISTPTNSITDIASEGRKPLPEKAPKDSAWISPFGPLTTKAVKAASPRVDWTQRDRLKNVDPISNNEPDWLAEIRRILKGSQGVSERSRVTYGTGEAGKPVSEICIVMQHWGKIPSVFCATNLCNQSIIWNSKNIESPKDLVASLEKALNQQGVTFLRANEGQWWAVPTEELKTFVKPIDPRPYSLLYTYSLIIALVCGTAGLPHILVRFYTNPDGVAAKRTTMWVMILIGVFYVFPPVLGVIGRNLMPELYAGTGAKGTDKIVLELPRILNERVPMLGSILSGIACAGAFAAFMSTFSGLLVSMTGAMAHDVYGRILRPKSTPQERMKAFKVAAFGIGGVSVFLGMQVEQLQINFMVGQAFAIAAASYFPLLFMAIWWRGLTMIGAATGMLTGGLMALMGISLTSFSDLATTPNASKFFTLFGGLNSIWAAHPLLRILCEQPAIWAVPLAILLMIIVSKLTRHHIPADIRMKMLVLHAPEKLGLKQEYIQEHQAIH
jgi:cation/acetate symporter